MPERTARSSDLALLAVVLVWGANFPILKWALAAMPPHVMNVFRFLVSAAALGAVYAWRLRNSETSLLAPFRTHGRQLVVLGLLGYVVYQVCFIVGIDNTTSGSAALIMASAPLWTAVQSRIAGHERLRSWAWAGLALSLLGTGLVVAAGAGDVGIGAGSLFGNAMMLAAAAFWGAYTAFNTNVVHEVSPTGATFAGVVVALPVLLAISGPYWSAVEWAKVDVWVWIAIVFSGGLSTGLAIAVWNTAVKHVGASNTAVYGNLVPFVALLGGVLFLGEPITVPQIAGGALIIGGVVLVRRYRVRQTT
jgi:drug/metabolite transporter (DMT)-like permease